MKKTTNIISLLLVFISLAVLVFGRSSQIVTRPVVTVYVTAENHIEGSEVSSPAESEPAAVETPQVADEYFTFSFIGDCTFTSFNGGSDYAQKMGNDYSYPFRNTIEYFEDDEFTMANLECSFSDRNLIASSDRTFSFRCPSDYVNILTEGSIEFVNTANNHFDDFGQDGIDDTYSALESAGVAYGKKNETSIYTTANGIKIGIYCEQYNNNVKNTEQIIESSVAAVEELKKMGADYIICAYHWGNEGKYTVFDSQKSPAHAAIDAGADLVYASHPHVLQPVEEYNDGIIMYSLGNWSFGGNTHPSDPDTAIVQLTVKRDSSGDVSNYACTLIPCCVSSTFPPDFNNVKATEYNDYIPTPYEADTENYARTLSKLNGTFTGGDLNIDYSAFH